MLSSNHPDSVFNWYFDMQHQQTDKGKNKGNQPSIYNNNQQQLPPVVKINNHFMPSKTTNNTMPTPANKPAVTTSSMTMTKQTPSQQQQHTATATVPYKPPPSPTHQLLSGKSKSTIAAASEVPFHRPSSPNITNKPTSPLPPPTPPQSPPQMATIQKRVTPESARVMTVEVGMTDNSKAKSRPSKSQHHHRDSAGVERRSTHLGTGKQSIRSKKFVRSRLEMNDVF